MKYRKLGKTGLSISQIGLGSWTTFGDLLDFESSKKIISKAFDLGINFFDTADSYNSGKGEEILGNILKDFPREELVITTKCFFPLDGNSTNPNLKGLSRKHIIESVNSSLKRLNVDYIDLFQFHRFDTQTPIEETIDAVNDLIRSGKILYYGTSKWSNDQIEIANQYSQKRNGYNICSSQDLYNLFHREVEQNHLDFCKNNGIGFLAYSPLARGVISEKYLSTTPQEGRYNSKYKDTIYDLNNKNIDKIKNLRLIAEKYNHTLSQVALAYYFSNSDLSSTIIGCSKIEQLEENIKSVNLALEQEDINLIKGLF